MLGCFVSTLPLTLTPNASAAARDYLADTGKRIMELLDRQDTPLERLLPLGKTPHSLGGNPLYSALFSLRPKSEESLALDGHPLNLIPIPTHTAKLELSLEAAPQADGIAFTLEYASSLFEEATIALYGRCYRTILGEILADDEPCHRRSSRPLSQRSVPSVGSTQSNQDPLPKAAAGRSNRPSGPNASPPRRHPV